MEPSFATELVPGLPLRFPVALRLPAGFRPEKLETWPPVEGRLEFHEGQLLFMPPCADVQSDVVFSITTALAPWLKKNRRFVGASNEAGMLLAGSVRAADVAIWRREDLPPHSSGALRRVPPVLAVEVAGQDEDETALTRKAQWYLDHGVLLVWLVFPENRTVHVLNSEGSTKLGSRDVIPRHPALPGLSPKIREFFAQLR